MLFHFASELAFQLLTARGRDAGSRLELGPLRQEFLFPCGTLLPCSEPIPVEHSDQRSEHAQGGIQLGLHLVQRCLRGGIIGIGPK